MGGKMEEEAEESKLTAFVQTMNECFDLETKLHNAKEYALEHPVMTLFIIITVGMCSVPIFCFFAFAFGSTVLAFTGFLLVEGTVLTIGTLILVAVLCFVDFCQLDSAVFWCSHMSLYALGKVLYRKHGRKFSLGKQLLSVIPPQISPRL